MPRGVRMELDCPIRGEIHKSERIGHSHTYHIHAIVNEGLAPEQNVWTGGSTASRPLNKEEKV